MSVLRYPGGKTRAIKILEKYIPLSSKEIISPFFGGGSFELYMMNKHNIPIIANDKFKPLINFWKCLKTDKDKLITEVKKLRPLSKDKFMEIRKKILDTPTEWDNGGTTINDYERAAYYFAINRSSFSGSTCSGGYSKEAATKRFTQSSIDSLKEIDLKNITFECSDFSDFINKHNGFLFLDPPYYLEKKSKLYGLNGDLHESFDHDKLYDLLKTKTNWLLCYNNCQYIKDKYKDFKIIEVQWSYGMNKTKESSEILIMN